jgi:hypothetical protein
MGAPAGGSLTADQWLTAATVVLPLAVCHFRHVGMRALMLYRQIPQIWDEYGSGDPEAIRLQRLKDFKAATEKRKAAQAEARKLREAEKAAASQNARKSGRKRTKTSRAQVKADVTQQAQHTLTIAH